MKMIFNLLTLLIIVVAMVVGSHWKILSESDKALKQGTTFFGYTYKKTSEQIDFWESTVTYEIEIPNMQKKYQVNGTIKTFEGSEIPLTLHYKITTDSGAYDILNHLEFRSQISIYGDVITSLTKSGFKYEGQEKEIGIGDIKIEQDLAITLDDLLNGFSTFNPWGNELKIKLNKISMSNKPKSQVISLKSFETIFKQRRDANLTLELESSIKDGIVTEKELKTWDISYIKTKTKVGEISPTMLQALLQKKEKDLLKLFPGTIEFNQEFVLELLSNEKFILGLTFKGKKGDDLDEFITSSSGKFNLQIPRPYLENFLTAHFESKFKKMNDVKTDTDYSGVMKDLSIYFTDEMIKEGHFSSENGNIKIEMRLKEGLLISNDKRLTPSVVNQIFYRILHEKLDASLKKMGHPKYQLTLFDESLDLFKIFEKAELEVKTLRPESSTDAKIVSTPEPSKPEAKVTVEKTEEVVEAAMTKSTKSQIDEGHLRHTKTLSKSIPVKRQKLFNNQYSGIWYDKNKPNLKFHFYRGKNGLFYSEIVMMEDKGKVTPPTLLIYLNEGGYRATYPVIEQQYHFQLEPNKIQYQLSNAKGVLEKDQTHEAKIIDKFFALRKLK
ncbi:MAG: DUF945 family protein [Bacteriovoracaceae bacterium]|nr:DUF945 family protein [Bacteriovoracaceae bacterium]